MSFLSTLTKQLPPVFNSSPSSIHRVAFEYHPYVPIQTAIKYRIYHHHDADCYELPASSRRW